jgi:GDPmannose 4,6-dehydratase
MKTALISGITGQDGPYLASFLLAKGYKVIGTVRHQHFDLSGLQFLNIEDKVIVEEADLLDQRDIFRLFESYSPSEIYNLASQSSVGVSFQKPFETIHFNFLSVLNLLECIRQIRADIKLFQASTSEIFGKANAMPVTEATPINPLSPYGVSKAAAHLAVANYRQSYSLHLSNGILFSHESVLRGNNFFIKKVVSESIRIAQGFQSNLRVGNIEIRRDFGFAPMYVEAMWLMLQAESPDDYLICSGVSVSLKEIIEYVFTKLGISQDKLIVDTGLYRPADIEEIFGDNSKIKKKLNWQYEMSFFDVLDVLIENEREQLSTR